MDPTAGVSIEDPRGNQVAQKDVETALMDWGRYEPVMGADGADLLIRDPAGSREAGRGYDHGPAAE